VGKRNAGLRIALIVVVAVSVVVCPLSWGVRKTDLSFRTLAGLVVAAWG
jgi:hypothetical protein